MQEDGEGVSLSYTAGRGRQPPCWVASAVVTFNYSCIDRLADGPAQQPLSPPNLFFLNSHVKFETCIYLIPIETDKIERWMEECMVRCVFLCAQLRLNDKTSCIYQWPRSVGYKKLFSNCYFTLKKWNRTTFFPSFLYYHYLL